MRLLGRTALLRVSSLGTTERPRLLVELRGDDLDDGQLAAAVTLARRIFGADLDLADLEATAAQDPPFAALMHRFRGLRPTSLADPFETLVWAILGQQINVSFAAKLKRALVEAFGGRLRVDGQDYLVFPEPAALVTLDHERDLRPLQFSRQKSAYTILAARAVLDGALDLEALRHAPSEEAISALVALKGIGRWTAEYVLMRGLGHGDIIPAGDGGLRRIIGREYGLGRLASEAEARAIAEAWAPWRSFAAFYWWFTLQLEARGGTGTRMDAEGEG